MRIMCSEERVKVYGSIDFQSLQIMYTTGTDIPPIDIEK